MPPALSSVMDVTQETHPYPRVDEENVRTRRRRASFLASVYDPEIDPKSRRKGTVTTNRSPYSRTHSLNPPVRMCRSM
jgi:hypothetical protein